MKFFSVARMVAVFIKEFQQMMRDRLTFGMAVGIPILQLILFGYAINTDPKGLPTALVAADTSPLAGSIVATLQNTGYFRIVHQGTSEAQAEKLLESGEVQFLVVIPPHFTRSLVRGEKPALLVAVDATDPSASGNALAALNGAAQQALQRDLAGPLQRLQPTAAPYEVIVHRRYNPEGLSRYNIVPGLVGSFTLLMAMIGVFIVANLGVGFTFSTLARNQLQAMQMTFFFFLPSMLLSGFMFPFRGMPQWAQWLGEVLPLTHFLRIVRGIMLKGNTADLLMSDLWPMLAFMTVAGIVALMRYRQTLD
jgi:ABC-2 type transport system permease protein